MNAQTPKAGAPKRQGWSLMRQVRLLIMAPAVGILVFLNAVFGFQAHELGSSEMRKRGESVAKGLAANVAVHQFDRAGVAGIAQRTLAQVDDVAYVVVRDEKGEILADARAPALRKVNVADLPRGQTAAATTFAPDEFGGVSVLPVSCPVVVEDLDGAGTDPGLAPGGEGAKKGARIVGSVQLGLRRDALDGEIVRAAKIAAIATLVSLILVWFVGSHFARRLVKRVQGLAAAAAAIAEGDLAFAIQESGEDEVTDLARAFKRMAAVLRTMVADLHAAAKDVESEASSILGTSTQQSAMASQQASAINETSTTVSEIAQTSKQATEHADSVIKVAQRSEELSREGQRVVDEAMSGMEKMAEQVKAISVAITDLRERTLQIGDIIATVKDLAEQSNLLALNASIEASKAGEHGRGFAVVAMEMRNLAEQSKSAAGQVRAILSEVQKGTRAAVAVTEEGSRRAHTAIALAQSAGSSILGLAEVIQESSSAARQIANNTRQQTIGVEQIVSAITELSSAMNDALEGTKRIEAVAGNLTTVSSRLTEIVGRYRV